jgi:pyruvate formate lyase activating enzyme
VIFLQKAVIFNIQRYSLHDGGGIRTVIFFKGCPLCCPWCSNPESQDFKAEIMRKESLCIKCSSENCYTCLEAPWDCPTGALEMVGREFSIKELVNEVMKDIAFYETTGGGVTLSGGEPLSQGLFAIEFLKELRKLGVNTAMETTGIGSFEIIDEMTNYLDTVLWDFKIMDRKKSLKIINADAGLMKSNFDRLMKENKNIKVIPRIPLIPGYTSDAFNLKEIIEFIKKYDLKEVHILPYHQYGSSKYKTLGRLYELSGLEPLSKSGIENIQNLFLEHGIRAVVGGS